ncbi:hypothetical protein BJ508DRAFT_309666 [Ascobolus immersus RN42]|uniref:Uncharacterized protein n=1 Tax=Ascobolus immersus RN42 TaxID=1160509 RepID=A0A3N4I1E5_ASCIM|nr:hypothetical protein BJ508DRAFT_309666 [Ascobolus immersus RN42]
MARVARLITWNIITKRCIKGSRHRLLSHGTSCYFVEIISTLTPSTLMKVKESKQQGTIFNEAMSFKLLPSAVNNMFSGQVKNSRLHVPGSISKALKEESTPEVTRKAKLHEETSSRTERKRGIYCRVVRLYYLLPKKNKTRGTHEASTTQYTASDITFSEMPSTEMQMGMSRLVRRRATHWYESFLCFLEIKSGNATLHCPDRQVKHRSCSKNRMVSRPANSSTGCQTSRHHDYFTIGFLFASSADRTIIPGNAIRDRETVYQQSGNTTYILIWSSKPSKDELRSIRGCRGLLEKNRDILTPVFCLFPRDQVGTPALALRTIVTSGITGSKVENFCSLDVRPGIMLPFRFNAEYREANGDVEACSNLVKTELHESR